MKFNERLLDDKLNEFNMKYRKNANSFILDCPVCGRSETLYGFRESGYFTCQACKEQWNWKSFLVKVLGMNSAEVAQLGEVSIGSLNGKPVILKTANHHSTSDDGTEAAKGDDKMSTIALGPEFIPVAKSLRGSEYADKRAIPRSDWTKYDIRYHSLMDAIVFVVVMDGRTVGYQARFIDPKNPSFRMMSSQGFSKAKALYGYDQAKGCENLVITEGPVDMHHANIPGFSAIATFGKSVSKRQIELIKSIGAKNIYIGLDRDAAEEAKALIVALSECARLFRVLPPDYRKDLGETTQEEIKDVLGSAQEVDGYNQSYVELFVKRPI